MRCQGLGINADLLSMTIRGGLQVMRVVVVGGFAPSLINFRSELLEALVAAGHEVFAAASEDDPELKAELARRGVTYRPVALSRTGANPLADLKTLWRYYRTWRELKPDAVLAYTIKPISYGLFAARLAGVKGRYAMITGLGTGLADAAGISGRLRRAIAMTIYRRGLKNVSAVLFQNADNQAFFNEQKLVAPTGPPGRDQRLRGQSRPLHPEPAGYEPADLFDGGKAPDRQGYSRICRGRAPGEVEASRRPVSPGRPHGQEPDGPAPKPSSGPGRMTRSSTIRALPTMCAPISGPAPPMSCRPTTRARRAARWKPWRSGGRWSRLTFQAAAGPWSMARTASWCRHAMPKRSRMP